MRTNKIQGTPAKTGVYHAWAGMEVDILVSAALRDNPLPNPIKTSDVLRWQMNLHPNLRNPAWAISKNITSIRNKLLRQLEASAVKKPAAKKPVAKGVLSQYGKGMTLSTVVADEKATRAKPWSDVEKQQVLNTLQAVRDKAPLSIYGNYTIEHVLEAQRVLPTLRRKTQEYFFKAKAFMKEVRARSAGLPAKVSRQSVSPITQQLLTSARLARKVPSTQSIEAAFIDASNAAADAFAERLLTTIARLAKQG